MLTPLLPYQAGLVKTKLSKIMVIADLHIGWEIALSQKGIHVPSQTPKLLTKLQNLLKTYKPTELLILGDIKHTVAKAEISEWQDVPQFFNKLKGQVNRITVIRGNHDGNLEPLLPENVDFAPATGKIVSNVGFFHGHKWPSLQLLRCRTLVMGHAHPVIALRDPAGFRITRQVWVKAKCDINLLSGALRLRSEREPDADQKRETTRDSSRPVAELFIMPSFNDFLGGKPLNETSRGRNSTAIGPVLRSEAVDMNSAETFLLDGTFLGSLSQLRSG
jgi:putative SbcD/Mre11-related phosphoesterase